MKTLTLAQSNNRTSNPAKDAGLSPRDKQFREASRMFAGLFLSQMLKSMRESVQQSDFGHGGMGEQFFQSQADDAMAMEASKSQGYGLSDLVYRSFQTRNGMHVDSLPADLRKIRAYTDAAHYDASGVARGALPTGVSDE